MLLWKSFWYVLFFKLKQGNAVSGRPTFIVSFQTNIKRHTSATTNVWIEFASPIPETKEFTVCHWINILFYNSDIAACLWTYCTIENDGENMECVEVCLHAADYTLNRNLILQSYVILRDSEELAYKRTQLNDYRHRT